MILRFFIAAVFLYVLYRVVRTIFLPPVKKVKPLSTQEAMERQGEDLVEDPCCHSYLPVSQAFITEIDGVKHYFCSIKCQEDYKMKVKENEEAK
jgi:YHS domain-containing protein